MSIKGKTIVNARLQDFPLLCDLTRYKPMISSKRTVSKGWLARNSEWYRSLQPKAKTLHDMHLNFFCQQRCAGILRDTNLMQFQHGLMCYSISVLQSLQKYGLAKRLEHVDITGEPLQALAIQFRKSVKHYRGARVDRLWRDERLPLRLPSAEDLSFEAWICPFGLPAVSGTTLEDSGNLEWFNGGFSFFPFSFLLAAGCVVSTLETGAAQGFFCFAGATSSAVAAGLALDLGRVAGGFNVALCHTNLLRQSWQY